MLVYGVLLQQWLGRASCCLDDALYLGTLKLTKKEAHLFDGECKPTRKGTSQGTDVVIGKFEGSR